MIDPSSWTCRDCLKSKPSSEFYSSDKYHCKACQSIKTKERVKRNKIRNQLVTQNPLPDIEQLKRCRICKEVQSIHTFRRDNTKKGGYQNLCRTCAYTEMQKYRYTNPNTKGTHIAHRYAITAKDYCAMFEAQNNVCAICGRPETSVDAKSGRTRKLAVDHDHATGKVRGLLCHGCNLALGLLDDDLDRIMNVFHYIQKHKTENG
jgi:hypothetical protein